MGASWSARLAERMDARSHDLLTRPGGVRNSDRTAYSHTVQHQLYRCADHSTNKPGITSRQPMSPLEGPSPRAQIATSTAPPTVELLGVRRLSSIASAAKHPISPTNAAIVHCWAIYPSAGQARHFSAMTENPEPEELVPVDDLTPEEANRIIHSHRKVRYGESGALYIVHSYLPPVQAYCQSLISADGPQGPPAGRVVSARSSVTTSSPARTASRESTLSYARTSPIAHPQTSPHPPSHKTVFLVKGLPPFPTPGAMRAEKANDRRVGPAPSVHDSP